MKSNPHFAAVQRAQEARTAATRAPDTILAELDAMPVSDAYRIAQRALANAIRRAQKQAHERKTI